MEMGSYTVAKCPFGSGLIVPGIKIINARDAQGSLKSAQPLIECFGPIGVPGFFDKNIYRNSQATCAVILESLLPLLIVLHDKVGVILNGFRQNVPGLLAGGRLNPNAHGKLEGVFEHVVRMVLVHLEDRIRRDRPEFDPVTLFEVPGQQMEHFLREGGEQGEFVLLPGGDGVLFELAVSGCFSDQCLQSVRIIDILDVEQRAQRLGYDPVVTQYVSRRRSRSGRSRGCD